VDRRTVLILTQPLDRTSDHVILRLQKRGVDVVRFDTGWFPSEASLIASLDGDEPDTAIINSSIGKPVDLGKVASIWYRRPLDFTFSSELDPDARRFARDEALHGLGGVLRSVDCRWVNHPEKEVSAGYKPFQLASARSFIQGPGQSYIYKTLCVPEVVSDIYDHALVFTSRLTLADIEAIDTVRFTPCLLQQFVPKAFEIRATVINGKMFAVGLHAPDPDIDDWRQVTNDLTYSVYQMPADVEERSLRLVRELGLLFAAMDFVVTQEGEHVFLELNPSGQWTWLEAATGLPMVDTLADCLAPFSAAHAAHAGRAG
jgi:hypothetical protein